MTVLYVRSSQGEEDLERQLEILRRSLAREHPVVGTHGDLAPGTGVQRPALEELLGHLDPGDQLCVASLDRLARSAEEADTLVGILRQRGISLQEVQSPQRPDRPEHA